MTSTFSPFLGHATGGVNPDHADIVTVVADAGGYCPRARLTSFLGPTVDQESLDAVVSRGYLRRYTADPHQPERDVYQVTHDGMTVVRPAFAFDVPAALAWVTDTSGGESFASEYGIDSSWGASGALSSAQVRDLATFLADFPLDVFARRGNYRLTVIAVDGGDSDSHAFMPLVMTPDGGAVTEESPRELRLLFDGSRPSTGPGRLVDAVARVVSIANTLTAIRIVTR